MKFRVHCPCSCFLWKAGLDFTIMTLSIRRPHAEFELTPFPHDVFLIRIALFM